MAIAEGGGIDLKLALRQKLLLIEDSVCQAMVSWTN